MYRQFYQSSSRGDQMHQKCFQGTLTHMEYIPYIPQYIQYEKVFYVIFMPFTMFNGSGALSLTEGKSSLFGWFQKSRHEITTPSWTTPR